MMGFASMLVDRRVGASTVRGALAVAVLGLGAIGSAQAAQLTCGTGSTPVRVNTASAWSSDAVYAASAGGSLPGTPAALVRDYKWTGWFNKTTTNHRADAGGTLAGTPLQGDWLSFGDAQFTVGQANGGNTTTGSYPASSKPYPAVKTNGSIANGQWVNNAVTFTSNEPITIGPEVDLSSIKIRGTKALDDDGWFVVIPAKLPSGDDNTDFIRQTVVGGNWSLPYNLTLDGNIGLGFYYGDNTIGFAVRNAGFADTTSQSNPIGLFADFEITADCLEPQPLPPQPTTPLICAAGTTATDTVEIGPFTTNVRDWTWIERTNAAGNGREANDQPLFGDYRYSAYVNPAALTGATGTATAPTNARWISTGTVNPGAYDIPGVRYPEALGIYRSVYDAVVVKMNQPVVVGNNVNLASIKLKGRFAFNQFGDRVWVQTSGQPAAESYFNTLPDGYGALTTWTANTTADVAGTTPTFALGANSIGFVMTGYYNNTCASGDCAMGALAEFYVTAQCTGADPAPVTVDQTITFPQPATPRLVSSGTFTLAATASSGLPVTYTSQTVGVCTVDATTGVVTPVTAGTCTIAADQAGGDVGTVTYSAASQITRNITLQDAPTAKDPQAITFPAQTSPVTVPLGGVFPIGPAATADSGLPVTYTSLTPDVCTVVGSSVRVLGSGTCTIEANQAGNSRFDPAAPVTQSVTVNATTAAGVVIPVPTLDLAGLGLLSLLGAGAGALGLRRRKRTK